MLILWLMNTIDIVGSKWLGLNTVYIIDKLNELWYLYDANRVLIYWIVAIAVLTATAITIYSCCVLASRADDIMEQQFRKGGKLDE